MCKKGGILDETFLKEAEIFAAGKFEDYGSDAGSITLQFEKGTNSLGGDNTVFTLSDKRLERTAYYIKTGGTERLDIVFTADLDISDDYNFPHYQDGTAHYDDVVVVYEVTGKQWTLTNPDGEPEIDADYCSFSDIYVNEDAFKDKYFDGFTYVEHEALELTLPIEIIFRDDAVEGQ